MSGPDPVLVAATKKAEEDKAKADADLAAANDELGAAINQSNQGHGGGNQGHGGGAGGGGSHGGGAGGGAGGGGNGGAQQGAGHAAADIPGDEQTLAFLDNDAVQTVLASNLGLAWMDTGTESKTAAIVNGLPFLLQVG